MDPLDNLLTNRINKLGLSKELQAAYVLSKANTLADGRFQAVRYSRGILTLRCTTSIAAQELKFQEKNLLDQINQEIKPFAINRLSYQVRG